MRYRPDGTPLPVIAIPVFGYKSHISVDRRYGFIRAAAVTSASHTDGRMLRQVIDRENIGSEVWADCSYRSQSNEAWLADRSDQSHPPTQTKGQVDADRHSTGQCRQIGDRAKVKHVFAHQKNRFELFIRAVGITRAEAKLTLINLADNVNRLVFHEKRAVTP